MRPPEIQAINKAKNADHTEAYSIHGKKLNPPLFVKFILLDTGTGRNLNNIYLGPQTKLTNKHDKCKLKQEDARQLLEMHRILIQPDSRPIKKQDNGNRSQ
jgi:hypothetical protein